MDFRLQELCDGAEILDCLQRYARGIDRLDRELLRSAYHDGAIDDHVADSRALSTISSTGHSPTTRRRPATSAA